MSTTIPDLWPEKLITRTITSPASILRQQGYILGEKTKNYIIGKVESSVLPEHVYHHDMLNLRSKTGTESIFIHNFNLSCEILDYRINLFNIRNYKELYPCIFITSNLFFQKELVRELMTSNLSK